MQQTRQLAAILFTDIVGSTSMMQKDEQASVSVNKHSGWYNCKLIMTFAL